MVCFEGAKVQLFLLLRHNYLKKIIFRSFDGCIRGKAFGSFRR